MEKKEFSQKLKNTVLEKGSRFWLMIFVVVSTIGILVIWSLDIKKTYSSSASLKNDMNSLGVVEAKEDTSKTMQEFFSWLDKATEEETASSTEEEATTSSDLNLSVEEIDRLKQIVDSKINSSSSSTTLNISSSSVPSLYPELDDSEQTIQDLKKRIEELESHLDN